MNPEGFIKSLYLGDRFCKSILIDGNEEKVKIQINLISRIRSTSGVWNYYNDENIENGFIVFEGVESITFEPQGFIPNDEIQFVGVESIGENERKYNFQLSAASCSKQGRYTDVAINVIAKGIYLENPSNLGVEIRE